LKASETIEPQMKDRIAKTERRNCGGPKTHMNLLLQTLVYWRLRRKYRRHKNRPLRLLEYH
jgi:hypothetical protein